MAKKSRASNFIRCPSCKRNGRPWILERIQAFPRAQPPIPARAIVKCPAEKCGMKFYVVESRLDGKDTD